MGYEFFPGQVVAVVRNGKTEELHQVEEQVHGIVRLDDETRWYADTGLPVRGTTERRLTPLNETIERATNRRWKVLRLIELASVLGEYIDSPIRASEGELQRAEKALYVIARSLRPPRIAISFFLKKIDDRLDEAEKGAIQRIR